MSSEKNILLILERNNVSKDHTLIQSLKKELEHVGYELIFYTKDNPHTSSFLDPKNTFAHYPLPIRKIIKACILLKYPQRWGYFLTWFRKEESIKSRCRKLKKFILSLGPNSTIVILARSAGGRIASRIADELHIKKLICIGYPFKHPEHPVEPSRFEHLAHLQTPFLIIQGSSDEYGGSEIKNKYKFSPNISLRFISTNHDFNVSPAEWNKVIKTVKNFIVDTL